MFVRYDELPVLVQTRYRTWRRSLLSLELKTPPKTAAGSKASSFKAPQLKAKPVVSESRRRGAALLLTSAVNAALRRDSVLTTSNPDAALFKESVSSRIGSATHFTPAFVRDGIVFYFHPEKAGERFKAGLTRRTRYALSPSKSN